MSRGMKKVVKIIGHMLDNCLYWEPFQPYKALKTSYIKLLLDLEPKGLK